MFEIMGGILSLINGWFEWLFSVPVMDLPFTYGNLVLFIIISGILWKIAFGGVPLLFGTNKNKSKTSKEVGE